MTCLPLDLTRTPVQRETTGYYREAKQEDHRDRLDYGLLERRYGTGQLGVGGSSNPMPASSAGFPTLSAPVLHAVERRQTP